VAKSRSAERMMASRVVAGAVSVAMNESVDLGDRAP
jgi:hypothetical protein